MKIFKLEGKVQHYDWGGHRFIPALLHKENPENKTFAEYWMGAHPNASSEIVLPDGKLLPLTAEIHEEPQGVLGDAVYRRFGRLPYLFKVLDVKDMLSIQVHPSKKAAEEEFARENAAGVPVTAPHRNYKDDNHKPELMVALSEFWLLHGFKPVPEMKAVLQRVPELEWLLPVFGEGDYRALYGKVMELEQDEINRLLQPLLDRILPLYEAGTLEKTNEDFWAARAAKTFNKGNNIDKGIFSVYFFNLVQVQPGDAVFQDAGVPHAYLEGQNMEIMANSDNVLRGGLTNKHVDVPELLKHVKFEATHPVIVKGQPTSVAGEEVFLSPAPEFQLSRLVPQAGKPIVVQAVTAEIFLVLEGAVTVTCGDTSLDRSTGEAWLAMAGATVSVQAADKAVVFRASVPVTE